MSRSGSNKKVRNKKIRVAEESYEVFWVTEYVKHIQREDLTHSHLRSLSDLEMFLASAHFELLSPENNYYVALNSVNGVGFNAFCHLESFSKPKRCVVKTCYQISDSRILAIWKQELLRRSREVA
jgi:hypothetical protein